jgi:hypothetical protein
MAGNPLPDGVKLRALIMQGYDEKHTLEINIYGVDGKLASLPGNLVLPIRELSPVLDWLRFTAPVDISWTQFAFTQHYELMMDAYFWAAREKIMEAVANNQRAMPEAEAVIAAQNEPRTHLLGAVGFSFMFAVFSAVMATIGLAEADLPRVHHVESWMQAFQRTYIALTGAAVFIFVFMTVTFIVEVKLRELYHRWRAPE